MTNEKPQRVVDLDLDADQVRINGKPLGVPLSELRASLVFDVSARSGVVRLFLRADQINTIPQREQLPNPRQPDLMDELTAGDRFELEYERVRSGSGPAARRRPGGA